jgi:hypothetical protein
MRTSESEKVFSTGGVSTFSIGGFSINTAAASAAYNGNSGVHKKIKIKIKI